MSNFGHGTGHDVRRGGHTRFQESVNLILWQDDIAKAIRSMYSLGYKGNEIARALLMAFKPLQSHYVNAIDDEGSLGRAVRRWMKKNCRGIHILEKPTLPSTFRHLNPYGCVKLNGMRFHI